MTASPNAGHVIFSDINKDGTADILYPIIVSNSSGVVNSIEVSLSLSLYLSIYLSIFLSPRTAVSNSPSANCMIYDSVACAYNHVAKMSQTRQQSSTVWLTGTRTAWTCGGTLDWRSSTARCESYDPRSDRWLYDAIPSLPFELDAHSVTPISEHTLCVLGGVGRSAQPHTGCLLMDVRAARQWEKRAEWGVSIDKELYHLNQAVVVQ